MKGLAFDGPFHLETFEFLQHRSFHAFTDCLGEIQRYELIQFFPTDHYRTEIEPALGIFLWQGADPPARNDNLKSMLREMQNRDPLVVLNEILDNRLRVKLQYDGALRQNLFTVRMPFECAIAEFEGRRTAARLKRRFPEVC